MSRNVFRLLPVVPGIRTVALVIGFGTIPVGQHASAQQTSPTRLTGDNSRQSLQRELAWHHYWAAWDTYMYSSPLAWTHSANTPPLQRCPIPIGSSGRMCLGERPTFKSYRGFPTLIEAIREIIGPRLHGQPSNSPRAAPVVPSVRDRLQNAIDAEPDNGWHVGHMLLLSARFPPSARLRIAAQCRGNPGWCLALRAFVMDSHAYYREADSLYALALDSLPPGTSCQWRDMHQILNESSRASYVQLDCNERRAFEEKVWWFSDPLRLIAGNERRAAHFSRRVLDSLYSGGPSPFDRPEMPIPWAPEFTDMLVRFGGADVWINARDKEMPDQTVSWALLAIPNYSFVPQTVPSRFGVVNAEDFRLRIPIDSAQERYRPDYDFVLDILQPQIAAFPRGDSMVVVTVLDISREPLREVVPLTAAVFFSHDHMTSPIVAIESHVTERFALMTRMPVADYDVSLEALSDSVRVAGRFRSSVAAPAGRMSDFIAFVPASTLPTTLNEVLPLATGQMVFARGEPLGIFWETDSGDERTGIEMEISLKEVEPRPQGLFGWVGSLFSTKSQGGAMVIRWESTSRDTLPGNAIILSTNSLRPGRYHLELSGRFADGDTIRTSRLITIARRGEPTATLNVALNQPLARGPAGFTRNLPLVDPTTRVTGLPVRDREEASVNLLTPFRRWCQDSARESRWCERIVDGVTRTPGL